MSDVTQKRNLSDTEKACLTMVKNWEAAIKERRLTITLKVSPAAAEIIAKYDRRFFRVLKTGFAPASEDYRITFTLIEFRRYIEFVLPRAGLKLEIDGSMTTRDNLRINNSYLGSEMEPRK